MSIGSVAKFFLASTDEASSTQKTEIQPVVLQPRSLEVPSKTPDEVRQMRNEQARISSERKG